MPMKVPSFGKISAGTGGPEYKLPLHKSSKHWREANQCIWV